MAPTEGHLLYEIQRIDLEYAVTKSIAKALRLANRADIAEKVEEAAGCLQKATFLLQSACKWLDVSMYDQLKMDILDE
jgi:hypothetical protein